MFCCCLDNEAPSVEPLQVSADSAPPIMAAKEPEQAQAEEKSVEAPPPAPEEPVEPVKAPEEAPPPAPVDTSKPHLKLEFQAGGEAKNIIIYEAPLGITFKNQTPLIVKRVFPNGAGARAGVQEGWVFTRVGDKSLNGLDYRGCMEIITASMQPLSKCEKDYIAPGSFVIDFDTGDAEPLKVGFNKKPLGMSFEPRVPVTITKIVPGSVAEELGVKVGWKIKAVCGNDCDGKDFKGIKKLIQDGADILPSS